MNEVSARAIGYTYASEVRTTEYVDRRSKAAVTATPLEGAEGAKTFTVPAENDIRWFSVKAMAGDSLSIRADVACHVEVYAPSGTTLCRALGAAAMEEQALSLPEAGIYYVAVHDAETADDNLTLYFTHTTASMAGDANGDGMITVGDITTTVNYIIDAVASGFAFDAADMNGDGEITVGDVTQITNLVLAGEIPANAAHRAAPGMMRQSLAFVSAIAVGRQGEAAVRLDNPDNSNFVACQMDVATPPGICLESASLTANASTHKAMWREIKPGITRVIVFSLTNEAIDCNDAFLRLHFSSEADIEGGASLRIVNAIVDEVTPDKHIKEYVSTPAEIKVSLQSALPDTTAEGIGVWAEGMTLHIFSPAAAVVTVTNVAGQSVSIELNAGDNIIEMTQPGVYMVGNQKVILK